MIFSGYFLSSPNLKTFFLIIETLLPPGGELKYPHPIKRPNFCTDMHIDKLTDILLIWLQPIKM